MAPHIKKIWSTYAFFLTMLRCIHSHHIFLSVIVKQHIEVKTQRTLKTSVNQEHPHEAMTSHNTTNHTIPVSIEFLKYA